MMLLRDISIGGVPGAARGAPDALLGLPLRPPRGRHGLHRGGRHGRRHRLYALAHLLEAQDMLLQTDIYILIWLITMIILDIRYR